MEQPNRRSNTDAADQTILKPDGEKAAQLFDGALGVLGLGETVAELGKAASVQHQGQGPALEGRDSPVLGRQAWRTRFVQAAARWAPDADTEVLLQAMTGETVMGVAINGDDPADVGFAAAYVLASRP